MDCGPSGFVWVMGNLQSHGTLEFLFADLESHENAGFVMESHGKGRSLCKINLAVTLSVNERKVNGS